MSNLMHRPGLWLDSGGSEGEIILSSRVRLARNLTDYAFTHTCDTQTLEQILNTTKAAATNTTTFTPHRYVAMGDLSTLDRQFLAERHLVSREFLFNSTHRGLVINETEDICLMINEEDHLRLQAFGPGLSLEKTYERASKLDDELAPALDLAFDGRFGYLTACPTNLGTGMRASVLIHLPGLVHTKEIEKLLDSLRKLNHSIRGLYGEGSEVMGNFFQISNAATLGAPEAEIVAGLREMVVKIIGFERKAREMLLRKARSLLEDKVWRAYGLLRYARSVNTKEALSLISAVRLGVGLGVITDVDIRTLNELLVYTQPAHLQRVGNTTMDANERDVARASYIRERLAQPKKRD